MSDVPGLVSRSVKAPVNKVADCLVAAIQEAGVRLVARIDHAAAAEEVGLALAPSTVLIFGNAAAGTPLMNESATIAIDLPLKLLVWESQEGGRSVGYNDPFWVSDRHGTRAQQERLQAMRAILEHLSAIAAEVDP